MIIIIGLAFIFFGVLLLKFYHYGLFTNKIGVVPITLGGIILVMATIYFSNKIKTPKFEKLSEYGFNEIVIRNQYGNSFKELDGIVINTKNELDSIKNIFQKTEPISEIKYKHLNYSVLLEMKLINNQKICLFLSKADNKIFISQVIYIWIFPIPQNYYTIDLQIDSFLLNKTSR